MDQLQVSITVDQHSTRRETHREYFSSKYIACIYLQCNTSFLIEANVVKFWTHQYKRNNYKVTKLSNFDVKLINLSTSNP